MQVYLVGGAVRDKVLGKAVSDMDFVVVGSSIADMLAQGFKQVGADFPVFLHPKTQQEYALARTERKNGVGYTGFDIHATPQVTLEEDLQRRDLTMNAMAIEVEGLHSHTPINGNIIDPFAGLEDIKAKQLRHVSAAFNEDPLRVLRVARFYSRFADDGFTIADSTWQTMHSIVAAGEMQALSRERIWTESQRATMQTSPQVYWQSLYELGVLDALFLPLHQVWQSAPYIKQQILHALQLSAQQGLSIQQRWAIMMASFVIDKLATNAKMEHSPTLNDLHNLNDLHSLHNSHTIPKHIRKFAELYASNQPLLMQFERLNAKDLMQLLEATRANKQPAQLDELLTTASILKLSKQHKLAEQFVATYNKVTIKNIDPSLTGKAIGEALTQLRQHKLAEQLAADDSCDG